MPDIHWHVGEDKEQETIVQASLPRRSRRSWIAILIVVILGVGLGMAYRSLPESPPRPTPTTSPTPDNAPTKQSIPAALFQTIDSEAQALADGDFGSYVALQVPQDEQTAYSPSFRPCIQCDDVLLAWGRPGDDRPLYTIVDFHLRTQAKAWATIRQFRDVHWFHQTRFYQFNSKEGRWSRSDPDPLFWSGQTESLDTSHFHAIYAVEDRDFTPSIVQGLEETYPQVCRNLGCMEAAAALSFTLKLNGTSANGLLLSEDARELIFPSPRLTGVYENKSFDSSYLIWGITIAAVQRAYYGAATQWNGDADGHIVFNAIIDWAMQQMAGGPNRIEALAADLHRQGLVPLSQLWGKAYVLDQNNQMSPRADSNVIYPEGGLVIRFIAQKYGAQAMPKLLQALDTAQSFSDVIESGLGVPFAEFDQQWQAWINAGTPP